MQKKPIYLWVLLILSAVLSALSLFGVLSPVPTADSMAGLGTSGVDATYAQELVAYTIKVTEHSHSVFNIILVILSAILVTVALVFLVRQNIQLANYTYVAYVLVAIVGSIYNFMGVQDAVLLFTDQTSASAQNLVPKGLQFWELSLMLFF